MLRVGDGKCSVLRVGVYNTKCDKQDVCMKV